MTKTCLGNVCKLQLSEKKVQLIGEALHNNPSFSCGPFVELIDHLCSEGCRVPENAFKPYFSS